MNGFAQLHLLTNYPISNPNRDDLGRPKTAIVGGATRLRISSQSLKRAWRTSVIADKLGDDHVGRRTRELWPQFCRWLEEQGFTGKDAKAAAAEVAAKFGKLDEKKFRASQLAHVSPSEWDALRALAKKLGSERRSPTEEELELLLPVSRAADIALFGRMLAHQPSSNVEAAAQVAHAFSVHAIDVEDDYFTAVDDLNRGDHDAGAGHVNEAQFSAGLMYKYVCVDRALLVENLDRNEELARRTLAALIEAACTIAPSGKQNSFGSRTRASYVCAQVGSTQPMTLATAFLDPVSSSREAGLEEIAKLKLRNTRDAFAACYGGGAKHYELDVAAREGTLAELIDFAGHPVDA